MDYDALIKRAEEKIKLLNLLKDPRWFNKTPTHYKQCRTDMYCYLPRPHIKDKILNIVPSMGLFDINNITKKIVWNIARHMHFPRFMRFEVNPKMIFSPNDKPSLRPVYFYVHIPFCVKKCPFCKYYSIEKAKPRMVKDYVTALKKHLRLLLKVIPDRLDVTALHFGGGTPTYLTASQLDNLLNYVNNALHVKKGTPYTVEASPESLICNGGKDKLKILLNNHVNRLSIGVQSFSDTVLKLSKRAYSSEDAVSSVRLARMAGFKNINLDLMIGLPSQTPRTWYDTLKEVRRIRPESITLYYLEFSESFKPNAYMYNLLKEKPFLFPDKKTMLLMNLMITEMLSELKYTHNRPCSFTKHPKFFLYPATDIDILSLGISSWSFYNKYQIYTAGGLKRYVDLVNKGKLPVSNGIRLSDKLLMKKRLTTRMQFLNFGGLNKKDFENEFGLTPEAAFGKTLTALKTEGILEDKRGYLKLSLKGALCVDEVINMIYHENYPNYLSLGTNKTQTQDSRLPKEYNKKIHRQVI